MSQPKYRFYATLLDSYAWYLQSEQDEAFQEFIDKINRVPYEKSELALKGIAFNEAIDETDSFYIKSIIDRGTIHYDTFMFKESVVNSFRAYFKSAASQVYTSAQLETNRGLIELYGFADKVLQDTAYDIKTTSKYEFPKFIFGWQHKVYPYCFNQNEIFLSRFEYTVTDFNHIYKEQYVYNPENNIPELRSICESLVDFIELHKGLITDRKIFGLAPLEV